MTSQTIVEPLPGIVAAVLMVAGAVFVAQTIAWRLCGHCNTLTRWIAVLSLLAWGATVSFHLLVSRAAFRRGPALAGIALLAIAAWALDARSGPPVPWARRDRVFVRRISKALIRSRYRFIVAAFVVCVLPPFVHALILPPLGWDALTYHAVKAAMWVQHGTLAGMRGTGPWAYYRNMPAGSEVLIAWAMLPTSSDLFVPLLELVEWLSIGLATMILARQIGVREPFASTAAGFVMAIPTVRLLLGSGYAELCLLSTFVAGLALGLTAVRDRPVLLVLAAGVLGVSAATKLPMIAVTAVAMLVLLAPLLFGAVSSHRRFVLAAGVAYGLAFVPWLVYSTIDTGRPFSPISVKVGPLDLGRAPPEVTWYLDRGEVTGPHPELLVLRRLFAPTGQHTEALGLSVAVPLAGMVIGFGPLFRRRRLAAILLGAAALSSGALYFSPAFAVIRYYWTANSSRFVLPLATVSAVVAVTWCHPRSRAARLFAGVLIATALWNLVTYAFVGFSASSARAAALTGGGLVVFCGLCLLIARVRLNVLRWSLAIALLIGAGMPLQLFRDRLRAGLLQSDYTLHGFALWNSWARAVPLVDEPAVKYRIAVTSGPWQDIDNWFVYPFMGRRLQNEVIYVPISGDGRMRHLGPPQLYAEMFNTASFWAWQLRLQHERVTHVISFSPRSIELGWMETDGTHFERLAGAPGDWGLYRVK